MGKLDKFNEVVKDIDTISQKIIKRVSKLLEKEEKIKKEMNRLGVLNIDERFEEEITQIVFDAKIIVMERKAFIDAIVENNKNHEKFPFLHEVWSGTSYGREGVEGLQQLLIDLQEQYEDATIEELLKKFKS